MYYPNADNRPQCAKRSHRRETPSGLMCLLHGLLPPGVGTGSKPHEKQRQNSGTHTLWDPHNSGKRCQYPRSNLARFTPRPNSKDPFYKTSTNINSGKIDAIITF